MAPRVSKKTTEAQESVVVTPPVEKRSVPSTMSTRKPNMEAMEKFNKLVKKLNYGDHRVVNFDVKEQMFPTNSIVFDEILGLGGIPFGGRVIFVYGKEHGGKTTTALCMGKAYYEFTGEPFIHYDYERAMTAEYITALGIPSNVCSIRRPDSVQDGLDEMIEFLEAGCRLFILDSIPRMKNMMSAKEIKEGKAFKSGMGRHAQIISQFLDAILPHLAKYNACMIMINQVRDRIDGSQEAENAKKYPSFTNIAYTLPGGNAPRFVSSISLEINTRKAHKGAKDDPFLMEPEDKNADGFIATEAMVRVMKNKVTPAGYRRASIFFRPGRGIDDWISVRYYAKEYGLIAYRGKKYEVGDPNQEILASFDTKDEAIRNLVIEPDYELLARLKEQLTKTVRNDASGTHTFVISEAEQKFIDGVDYAGDDDEVIGDQKIKVADGDDADFE